MEILQIIGIALITVVFYLVLKERNSEFALQLTIAFGTIVFLLMISKIQAILQVFGDLAIKANVNMFFLNTIFKIIGIAYIAEFGSQICRDAGSSSIAGKIEFAAKIIILTLAIPIIVAILESVIKLIP
ncbi:stage III sporulation protein AD [Desulfonispora thiosulfatigenes DSM 11270]|uniref:Stage III sporulation protein AD n=1 Tax=Desulfonispora thiosulfatigenes DSM 11270 TaxID=656914 RepID=A0A1W1VN69_DESTI|nr:stage III sporulation protein AD [Desulfonispora thiosulfatigenes]SMB94812.1 stage III sporulation protein AD [Desulfonispora thiosulfatigenes DSM 11270]